MKKYKYKLDYMQDRLEKLEWYHVVEGRIGDFVYFSSNKTGYMDRLTPFFIILPQEKIVLHYGISSYLLAYKHARAVKGYIKTRYKTPFIHYRCSYEEMRKFIRMELKHEDMDKTRIF